MESEQVNPWLIERQRLCVSLCNSHLEMFVNLAHSQCLNLHSHNMFVPSNLSENEKCCSDI